MSIDLHKLRIFEAIARTGSFSRAAESVFVTQPTASQQIAHLESALGVTLFIRGTRKAKLSAAGEALLPYAEQILALVETAADSARAAAGLSSRTLRLGVGHTLATYLLPELLREYRDRFADRRVRITLGNTAALLEQVDAGNTEIALVGTPAARPAIRVVPFFEDRIVAIAPADSEMMDPVALDTLLGQTLLVREPGSALYATVEQILGPAALQGENVMQLGETEAIKRCVEAGLGAALIQEIAVREEVAAGRLKVLSLIGIDDRRAYAYAVKESGGLSAPAADFIEALAGSRRT